MLMRKEIPNNKYFFEYLDPPESLYYAKEMITQCAAK